MKIAIDIRSLQSGQISGVENYTSHVIEHLLKLDPHNTYTLFYNSITKLDFANLHFINSKIVNIGVPNKILNAGVRFFGVPSFEKFTGPVDVVFLPNFNHVQFSPATKMVVTVHDLSAFIEPDFFDLKRRLWHRMINAKKQLQQAAAVVAVSDYTKQDIVRLFGIDVQKIHKIYPGVSTHPVSENMMDTLRDVRNRYGLPGRFILFVSTLEPRKNILGLIEAFERMPGTTSLVIAGKPGWKVGPIMQRMQKSPKRRFIKYLGYVPERDKPYIIKLARVVAYPSFYEGFGFVPLEAMAQGTPVVASSVSSLPEVVDDAALLVNPYDTKSLAYALSQIIEDDSLRARFQERGKQQVKKYSWEQSAQKLHSLFNSLTNTHENRI